MTWLAWRLAGDGAADDVVQETLTWAWRRRSTYDMAKGSALPWLLAITADRARRHHKPRQRSAGASTSLPGSRSAAGR